MTVVDWLLDSDPSVRWQVMRDLTDAPAEQVAAERARVASEGAGARLLALQAADGRWGGAAWNHGWDSTMHVLWLLREMGLDPASSQARRALGLVRERVTWRGCGPQECDGNPFFVGEVEPCINGQVAASGAYFGQDVRGIVERLLGEQLPDGGWNCEAESGSTRSSFNSTICVLEALLDHERAVGSSHEVTKARLRGQEYLLERRLFRRRSTGEVIERDRKGDGVWTRFAFPTWWHYDVLRGLEYLRSAGVAPDERVAEAIELLASKRDGEGRWPLETLHAGRMPVETDEGEGRPSRWNTLRALRVLRWYGENGGMTSPRSKTSAGILLFRQTAGRCEVLLVHPGGPFWARKDDGAWSIPKGEFSDEDPLAAALREFQEETGLELTGDALPLEPLRQPSGKLVHAWAMRGDFDPGTLKSNSFSVEWPPRSGRQQEFPEVDRAGWFDLETAERKLLAGQAGFLHELRGKLGL